MNKTITQRIVTLLLLGVFITTFFVGKNYGSVLKSKEPEAIKNNFSVNYENKHNSNIKIRYKYLLDYESAETLLVPEDWDSKQPLFTLSTEDSVVYESFFDHNKSMPLPEVSDVIILKPGEKSDSDFEMNVNKLANNFQDKIRFEARIIVEELTEGKWNQVYQVILMERGPYWSLDKGPIEILSPID